jgi:hypothetical protein
LRYFFAQVKTCCLCIPKTFLGFCNLLVHQILETRIAIKVTMPAPIALATTIKADSKTRCSSFVIFSVFIFY